MTRARNLADYVSTGVTAAEFDFLDTTSGTPGSGNFLRGDKTWVAAAADPVSGDIVQHVSGIETGTWNIADGATDNFETGSITPRSYNTTNGYFIFNEDGGDYDFRVEADDNENMIFVDGAEDHVNIGTATNLGGTLNVEGIMVLQGVGATAQITMRDSGGKIDLDEPTRKGSPLKKAKKVDAKPKDGSDHTQPATKYKGLAPGFVQDVPNYVDG